MPTISYRSKKRKNLSLTLFINIRQGLYILTYIDFETYNYRIWRSTFVRFPKVIETYNYRFFSYVPIIVCFFRNQEKCKGIVFSRRSHLRLLTLSRKAQGHKRKNVTVVLSNRMGKIASMKTCIFWKILKLFSLKWVVSKMLLEIPLTHHWDKKIEESCCGCDLARFPYD